MSADYETATYSYKKMFFRYFWGNDKTGHYLEQMKYCLSTCNVLVVLKKSTFQLGFINTTIRYQIKISF